MVPFGRNPFFVGRESELDALKAALAGNGTAAITQVVRGLGGMGKTQTAVEYAYRHRDDYSAVLWTRADDEAALTAGFVNIAKAWALPGADAPETAAAVQAAKNALEQRSGWLLVVDNADDPDLLLPFLPPKPQGHILITSRARNFRGLSVTTPLEIKPLPEVDALAFFAQSTGRDWSNSAEETAAKELAHELGYLPLALEQAAAYILRNDRTFRTYFHEFQTKREVKRLLYEQPQTGNYQRYDPASDGYKEYLTVWTTWDLNFQAVKERDSDSADLLTLCALLAPAAVPVELVIAAFPERFKEAKNNEDSEIAYIDLLLPLSGYSLITEDRKTWTFSIHRMVQTVLHDRLDDPGREEWHTRAMDVLIRVLPDPNYDVKRWGNWERLLPHALAVSRRIELQLTETPQAAFLLSQIGYYLYARGLYTVALPLYHSALSIREKVLGREHPDTADILDNIAGVYRLQGNFAYAMSLAQRAFSIIEKFYGPDNINTAFSLNTIASIYAAQGDYSLSMPLYLRALAIFERTLGPEHLTTSTILNNMGHNYRAQGNDASALPMLERALAIHEKVYGTEHPGIAPILNNLGGIYLAQEDNTSAQRLYQRAVTICEKTLGPNHPDTATSLNNLADSYQKKGDYSTSLPLLKRVLSIREQSLGSKHHDTGQSLSNLAYFYNVQGDYVAALPLAKRGLLIREQALGGQHPDTATSLSILADVYRAQEKYSQALPLYKRALAICEKFFGMEHPATARMCANVAFCYGDMGLGRRGLPYVARAKAIFGAHNGRNRGEG